MRFLCPVLLLAAVAPLAAQSVQYRSPEGVEYRSLPDTGPIARAQAALAQDPRNVDKILALGAAQSAARQFREAIETYSRGLTVDSTNAMLYRWRGHRYLSVRDTRSEFDLTKALELDSANYGALYHLGIIWFARGDYSRAADLFSRALRYPPNAGELAGSTDWLWMSLARGGRADEAAAHLARRTDSLPVANAYATRLKLYREEIGPDSVFTTGDTADTQVATLAYGLGNWYLVRGDTARAIGEFRRAVALRGWPAFGFIVAEAELRRLRLAATRPGREFMRSYLRRLDSLLSPLAVTREAAILQMNTIARTRAADSVYWQFRRTFAGKVDGVASVLEDSTFAVLVDPQGVDAQKARRQFDRQLEPIARDSLIADAIRSRLAAHGVWPAWSEGSTYLEPDQRELLRHFRKFLTSAGIEAAEIMIDEQVSPTADDGSVMVSMDTLGQRLARAERFEARFPRHVAASEIAELRSSYLRFFISGSANTSWFDRETHALTPEAHRVYADFVARYPGTRAAAEVARYMSLLAQYDFRRTGQVDAYLRSFWR